MTGISLRFMAGTLLVFAGCGVGALAQTAGPAGGSANAEVLKLIQAGMPEAVVINRIQANAGAFDVSADALIALKKAGATDAELAAITAAAGAAATVPVSAPTVISAPAASVEAFGGQLLRTKAGDPYVQFPAVNQDVFPDGRLSNTASLVIYQGEPAILIPSKSFGNKWILSPYGNMLFMKGRAIFDWYLDPFDVDTRGKVGTPKAAAEGNHSFLSKEERQKVVSDPSFFTQKKLSEFPVVLPLVYKRERGLGDFSYYWGPSQKVSGDSDTYMFSIGICSFFQWNNEALYTSGQLQLFVQDLQKDFDAVLAAFEKAAGITDITTQLSPRAHYEPISEEESQRYKVLLTQRFAEEKAKQGSKSWLASLNQLNDAVSLGSGLKTMGSGLVNGSGSAMAAGLQTTTASANAMAAVGTQAQYAANAQMQASVAQSNAAYTQAAAGSQYAAPSTAAIPSGSVAAVGSSASSEGTGPRSVVLADGTLMPTGGTATFSFTIVEGPLQIVSSPAGISCPGTCSHTFPAGYGSSVTFYITWQPGWFVTPENGSYLACGNGATAGGTGAATKNPPGGTLTCTIPTNGGGNSTTNETLWVHKYGELWPGSPAPTAITTPSTPSSPYTLPKNSSSH